MWLVAPRIAVLTCVLVSSGFAQQSITVAKLVDAVKSSVALKLPDKEVAAYVTGVQLTQKLDDSVVEDLQTQGAGPKTVQALVRLADQSAQLAPPPPPSATKPVPTGPPPPSKAEQERILGEVSEYARNYVKSLPDFLCIQKTRRSLDTHFQAGGQPSWTPSDRFAEKLSFVDHKENYELISHGDKALFGKSWESVGGGLSRGEWASLMGTVFDPESATDFHWLRWGNINHKLYHVYEYRVDQAHSREILQVEKDQKLTPAFHGLIYVPSDVSIVWWITVEPEIPAGFPMQDVKQTLKYDYADINGQRFILPASSDVIMRVGRVANHNEIEFSKYQKYSADAKITFDDIDEPPPAPKAPGKP